MMKKFFLLIGALFFAFLVAAVSAPFFVDVDKYRPEIVRVANENINGKLELGKLSLSLWGAVKVGAESIVVSVNGFDRPLLKANEFRIEIPYLSLLTGPQVIAVVKNPKIVVERTASGILNLNGLMKTEKTAQKTAPLDPGRSVAAQRSASGATIPAALLTSSLGISVENGDVDVLDRQSGAKYQLAGLKLEGRNLGVNRRMALKFNAPVKGTQTGLVFQGAVGGDIDLEPIVKDGALRSAKGTIILDAGSLDIEYGKNIFRKSASMPLRLEAAFDGNDKELMVRKLDLNFYEFMASGKGIVSLQPALRAKVEVTSNSWNLSKLEDFVPLLKPYGLKGMAQLNAEVNSDGNRNSARGDLKISDGQVFMKDFFKEPLMAQVQTSFSENSISVTRMTLSAPDSDIQVQGNIRDLNAPKFSFSINGKSLNVDKALVLPVVSKQSALLPLIATAYAAVKEGTVNPMMAMMTNPFAAKASGNLNVKIAKITAMGAEMKDVDWESQLLPGGIFQIKKGTLAGFGGRAAFSGAFSLKSPGLDYKINGKSSGVSAKEVIAAYFPKFKNTLEGKVDADWNVAGKLYPAATRMAEISGTVKIHAANGTLRTADFKESIQGVMVKVPFLKGKRVPDWEEGFKTLRADMKFERGNIQVDPMELISKGKGFDVKGRSRINAQLEQESYFDIYDPNGLLPKEISQPGKVALPLKVVGSLTAPKTDFGYTVSRLASTTGKEAAKKALSKGLQKFIGGKEGEDKGDTMKNIGDQLKKKFKVF